MGARPRSSRRVQRLAIMAAVALVVVSASGPRALDAVSAGVGNDHLTLGGVEVGGSIRYHDYASGTPVSVPAGTAWGDGTHLATRADLVPDELTLDHYGSELADPSEPWWDEGWRSRRCFDIDHAAAGATTVADFQVAVMLDTQAPIATGEFDPDGQDLRAARHDGLGFVDLDLWVDPTTLDRPATVVWVQVDEIVAAGTTDFCLYWNNAAVVAPASDEASVFTSASPRTLYYTVSDGFGPGADRVDLAPYLPGTQISQDGDLPVAAGAGQVVTFTENGPDSSYAATGPLAAVGADDGQDTLVPAAFAGTEFVVPLVRDGQTFSVRSPWAATDLVIADGTTTVASLTVGPGDGTVTVAADVTGERAGVVRSTNGVPFLLTHRSDVGGDSVVAVPATTEDLIGVQSQYARLGFGGPAASAEVQRSDATVDLAVGDEDDSAVFGPSGAGGSGPGVRITAADTPAGAVQHDDGNGDESTAFWPEAELNARYLVPVDAAHVTVACPVAGTEISFGGGPAVPCAGSDVDGRYIGQALDDSGWGVTTQALTVESVGGERFWLSFDRGSGTGAGDETQVGGLRQGRQVTFPAPVVSARAEEGTFRPVGLWDSAPVDTGTDGVYGLLAWDAATPAGTSVRFQLASGPTQLGSVLSPFVGPDGTDATFYTVAGTPAAYAHDFDRWVRIRAYLGTSDPGATPTVAGVTLASDLGVLGGTIDAPATVAVPSPAGISTSTWVARVHTLAPTFAGSESIIRSAGAPVVPGVDSATVSFARPDATQVVVAGEIVTQPAGAPISFEVGAPHSILVESTVSGPAALDVAWSTLVGGGSPLIERRLRLEFSG